ncbi:MAG: ankyrin repeat domain-containing protein, partial [Bdellovibrionia bacterium]
MNFNNSLKMTYSIAFLVLSLSISKSEATTPYSLEGFGLAAAARLPDNEVGNIPHYLSEKRALLIRASAINTGSSPTSLGSFDPSELLWCPSVVQALFILHPDKKSFWQKHVMSSAIQNNSLSAVQSLLDSWAEEEAIAPGKNLELALRMAVQENKIKIAETLLIAKADPNQFDSKSDNAKTPWMLANELQNQEMANLLIRYGADS